MKTAGIIAEYNPFHNGHAYHIDQTRKQTGADYIVAVMSGSFVQRGAPALLAPSCRTEMALRAGVDLVLELPVCYAAASAEFFAQGAVSILDGLNAVDYLSFGSEAGETAPLMKAAQTLLEAESSEGFQAGIKSAVRQGYSYPLARSQALKEFADVDLTLFDSPNNILGIEYCKALLERKSQMLPFTVAREGAGYHDTSLGETSVYGSATAIRAALAAGSSYKEILPFLPACLQPVWEAYMEQGGPLFETDFSALAQYCLLTEEKTREGFTSYADITPDLSDKLVKNRYAFKDWSSFCLLLKSRDMTYTRISRCLCHMLLRIQTEDMRKRKKAGFPAYARILGFRREAAPLLAALGERSSIPIITKLAGAGKELDQVSSKMLEEDILAAHIYRSVLSNRYDLPFQNEYQRPLVIL